MNTFEHLLRSRNANGAFYEASLYDRVGEHTPINAVPTQTTYNNYGPVSSLYDAAAYSPAAALYFLFSLTHA